MAAKQKQVTVKPGILLRGEIYYIRFSVNGVPRTEKVSDKLKDAEKMLAVRKGQKVTETLPTELRPSAPKKVHMFADLADKYDLHCQIQKSYKREKRYKIAYFKELYGMYPVSAINLQTLEELQRQLRAKAPGKKKLKAKAAEGTANRYIALLKNMITKAVDWDMATMEQLKKIREIAMFTENDMHIRYLSDTECKALLDACAEHIRPMILFALHTGLRRENVLELEWENIDWIAGVLKVDVQKGDEPLRVPMTQTMRQMLEAMPKYGPFVFSKKNGKRYKRVDASFKLALAAAGIEKFRLHDLRHTFASHLVMNGQTLYTVAELLGHGSTEMTKRYAHLSPHHREQAVAIMDQITGSAPPTDQPG